MFPTIKVEARLYMTCAVGFQWSCVPAETIRSRREFRPRLIQPRTVSVPFHFRCSCVRIVREPIVVDWALWGPMEEEGDAFYVVRKGNTVGVYKSLKDCQSQVGLFFPALFLHILFFRFICL